MEKLVLRGGVPLRGTVVASGAKNAALPILIATLVAPGQHRFVNVPELTDTSQALSLLGRIGCPSLTRGGATRIDTERVAFSEAPYDVVRKMRASVLVLGPLLARCGEARVSLPGGCAIGVRPIDQHLKGLEALGCQFDLHGGYVYGRCDALRGADFTFDVVTVTGTENVLSAAVLAEGETRLRNAAREPEVVELCRFLQSLGAKIDGVGTDVLAIQGVPRLTPASRPFRILPDRIETGTYLAAAAITGGEVTVSHTDPTAIEPLLKVLCAMGCVVETGPDWVRCRRDTPLMPVRVETEPHPGFPTDMQAQLMALCCFARGTSVIVENIFENRFMHAAELMRMGAEIEVDGKTAYVHGGKPLTGASVMASDLRASAALVLAALAVDDLTEVLRIYHLDRGYEQLVEKLQGLGARIARVSDAITDPRLVEKALDKEMAAVAVRQAEAAAG